VNQATEITLEEIKTLAEINADTCVSIYMPTHRAGSDIQQDPIRLRNLLGEAERRLDAAGMRPNQVRELLAPADELIPRHSFWQHQSDGLAVFLAPGFFRHYRVPVRLDELVVTAPRLHLKPLLTLLSPDGRFFILALSQNQVRLLEGTRHSVRELDLENVPQSLAEALRYDDPEPNLQFHTSSGSPGGPRPAMFHGHGPGDDNARSDVLRYFHKVDAGLREWLAGRKEPLVLAGVEYLLPIYREASSYPHLLEDGLEGNPDGRRAEELHEEAWALVEPHFSATREAAAERFQQVAGGQGEQASTDVVEIVPAAQFGRVESLFVTVGRQLWGTFDPETGEVQLHDEPEPNDQDLLDVAAVQTLLNGGGVYAVEADDMPADASVAAVFRY
jgi:hypothetical protein